MYLVRGQGEICWEGGKTSGAEGGRMKHEECCLLRAIGNFMAPTHLRSGTRVMGGVAAGESLRPRTGNGLGGERGDGVHRRIRLYIAR